MGAEPLAAVCELAFTVAKEGVDQTPPIEPPAAMRSYLYVARLPVRAFTVTERVLDTDEDFRRRVADRATEENVGRAGYLWVHRPEGWEAELAVLAPSVDAQSSPPPMPAPPVTGQTAAEMPPIPEPSPLATDALGATAGVLGEDAFETPPGRVEPAPASQTHPASVQQTEQPAKPLRPGPAEAPAPPTTRLTALSADSIIEDELSSLRELVDRLADERKNVRDSVKDLEVEVETRRAETYEMTHHLQTTESELAAARANEVDLADQLGKARARVEALEAERAELIVERDSDRAAARSISDDRDAARTELAELTEDRDRLESVRAALEVERNAFGTERDRLRETNAELEQANLDLEQRLEVAEQARIDLERELSELSSGKQHLQVEVSELNQQRSELIRRVAELAEERDRVSASQQDVVTSMTTRLEEISHERELILIQLEATQLQLEATRTALDTSHQAVVDELSKADDVIAESFTSLAKIDGSVGKVSEGIDRVAAMELDPVEVPIDDSSADAPVDVTVPDPGLSEDETAADHAAASEHATGPEDIDAEGIDTEDIDTEAGSLADAGSLDDPASVDDPVSVDAEPEAVLDDAAPSTDESVAARPAPPIPDPDHFDASTDADFDASTDAAAAPHAPDLDELVSFGEPVPFGQPDPVDPPVYGSSAAFGETAPQDAPDAPAFDDAGDDSAPSGEPDVSELAEALAGYGLGSAEASPPSEAANEEAAAVGGRARLQVPDELADDELASARYLVHGSDVVLLVDGDEAARQGWSDFPVADQRRALVQYLNQLAAELSTASDVIFYESVSTEFPEPKAVRVRECDDSVPRPDYFSGIVDGYPEEWPIVVVTDDLDVQAASTARGANTISCVQLLDVLMEFYTGS